MYYIGRNSNGRATLRHSRLMKTFSNLNISLNENPIIADSNDVSFILEYLFKSSLASTELYSAVYNSYEDQLSILQSSVDILTTQLYTDNANPQSVQQFCYSRFETVSTSRCLQSIQNLYSGLLYILTLQPDILPSEGHTGFKDNTMKNDQT